jgi:nucleotide-binding universal stress UspA family protein/sporulation protein YlmC with PRC-barrel domain
MSRPNEGRPGRGGPAAAGGLRILVPLDESRPALRALLYAQTLVSATDGKLKLIRASGVEALAGWDRLDRHARRLRERGVSVEWSVVEDLDAVSAILDAARTWRPDLIAMATTQRSSLDRWFNESVTDAVIRSTDVPVLVVPPDWERRPVREQPGRILVPLDGSSMAEQAVGLAMRFADFLRADLVLLRVVDEGASPRLPQNGDAARVRAAQEYLRQIGAQVESALPDCQVGTRVVTGSPAAAIAQAALDLEVDAIIMATRGRSGLDRAVLGSAATATLERSTVPLLLLGPRTLVERSTTRVEIGAPVRTRDGEHVGQVHRVVLDLEQQAVVGVVVLRGPGLLARDVLVPIDLVEQVDDDGLTLRLTAGELDRLPDFAFNEFTTPPPTWTLFRPWPGPALVPVRQRKRLGPAQVDVTPGTKVMARDGELGTVDRIELDPSTARLEAFWVRAGRIFTHDMRIPAEWIRPGGDQNCLRVVGSRGEIDAYLGHESRARLSS